MIAQHPGFRKLRPRRAPDGQSGLFCVVLGAALLLAAAPAGAERYHVMIDGQRTSGPSVPDDWTPPNCYPTIAAGLQQAGAADTLLLAKQDHIVSALLTVRALLANLDLDDERGACRILLTTGGGLLIDASSAGAVIRGVTFAADTIPTARPALRIAPPAGPGTAVLIEACAFEGLRGGYGSGQGGAAVHAAATGERLALTVRGTTLRDCIATGRGGAVYAGDGVDLVIEDCVLEENEAYSPTGAAMGGAVAVMAAALGSSLTMERSLAAGNRSWGPGGGIYVQDGHMTLRDAEVRDSRSAWNHVTNWSAGAGVFLRRVRADTVPVILVAERSRFIGNRGDLTAGVYAGDGGGMMVRGSDTDSPVHFSITDCLFADNFNDQGAGLYVGRGASGSIERCLFLNNTAHSNGGGAYKGGQLPGNLGETALFSYCVFAGNRAGWDQSGQPVQNFGWGGAFMVRLTPRAEFHNCTFADNLSGPRVHLGDAIYNWGEWQTFPDEGQRSRLVNCLFYGQTGNDVQVRSDPEGFSEVLNCAWEPGQFIAIGVTPEGTVELSGSPFVAPDDWRLTPGSACIDAALPLGYAVDIDSTLVPRGLAPDIGAYEYIFPVGVGETAEAGGAGAAPLLRLRPAHPNPANPRATVAFTLARAAAVELAVHDLAGRRVATLLRSELAAGQHTATWDGRDDRGAAAASGLYVLRLSAGGAAATQKLLLVR